MFPLEFCGDVNREETRVMGLSYHEDRMIVAGSHFGMIPACDRPSVRQTESVIANTVLLKRCKK